MKKILIPALTAAAAMMLWAGLTYYKLAKSSNAVTVAWALVETDLQARFDRIPDLLAQLKNRKYGSLTKRLLEEGVRAAASKPGRKSLAEAEAAFETEIKDLAPGIILLRGEWGEARSRRGKMSIAPRLDSQLSKLESLLGSMDNGNYMRLNNNLPWVIELYNRSADSYNDTAESFPGNILVRLFGLNRTEELMPGIPSSFYGTSSEGAGNS
ncbi:MAG: hypothetical protein Q7R35_12115 [Elusimicrobiota bacterium]|nr:hypothetical protein [Elusimicrobiota bacterium]